MSIQSEITRLETAKNDIASAIGAKGVTVPSGTKLDGMASLIEDIEAGGGGGDNIFKVETGALTCSLHGGIGTYVTLSGLSFVPKQVMVYESTASLLISSGSYGTNAQRNLLYIQSGLFDYCRYTQKFTSSSLYLEEDISGKYFSLSVTGDGFLLEGKHKNSAISTKLKYIVIG